MSKVDPQTIDAANGGNIDAILKLKSLAEDGDTQATDALEKLYWDGNKEHAVGTVVIREGVTTLANDAFMYCDKLKKVILPDSLISIADGADGYGEPFPIFAGVLIFPVFSRSIRSTRRILRLHKLNRNKISGRRD